MNRIKTISPRQPTIHDTSERAERVEAAQVFTALGAQRIEASPLQSSPGRRSRGFQAAEDPPDQREAGNAGCTGGARTS